MDLVTIPSPQDLISSTAPSQTPNVRLQRLQAGRDAAKKILSRYPDYGKASPEYIAGIAELLASYPDDILKTAADNRIGISAVNKFLPTQADIIEYIDKLEQKRYATRDIRQGRVPEPIGKKEKPTPFPALWKAFADEPDLLVRTFNCLCDASKRLALDGKEAARDVLMRAA